MMDHARDITVEEDEPKGVAAVPLHRPGLVVSALLAALTTAAVCYPVWPGYMSYDSLLAYGEAIHGVTTALWPPMHPYLFALSRAVGAGPGGLFAAQTLILFLGANIAIHSLVASRRLAAALCVVFALTFVAFPSALGTLLALWHDVPTTSFAIIALALWLQASRLRSTWLLGAALAAFTVSMSLRYNTLPLLAGFLILMLVRPFLARREALPVRRFALAGIAVMLAAAWASTTWRLPDLQHLPRPDSAGGTQEFDLIGVSACAGRNFLPATVTGGQSISPRQIREAYDPRHLQRSLAPKPGVPRLVETAGPEVSAAWRYVISHETGCYLSHRLQVFREQMGLAADGPFYPVHGFVDRNPYGFSLAHPAASRRLDAYIQSRVREPWRRPVVLYCLTLAAAVLGMMRLPACRPLIVATAFGIVAFLVFLFIAGPAADSRYIFPSNTMCALLLVTVAGLLVERSRAGRNEPERWPIGGEI